jgi:Big-like domain-containing protein
VTSTRTLRTFALASVAAIACQTVPPQSDTGGGSPPGTGVAIDLDRTSYRAGSQVRMRLTNHTDETVGFNPCTRIIERRQGDSWVTVPEPGRVCTMQLYLLSPHATRTETTELPSWIPRGTYRLALVLTRENAGVPAPTVRAVSGAVQVE